MLKLVPGITPAPFIPLIHCYKTAFFPLKVICNFHNVVWLDREFFLLGYLGNLIFERMRAQEKGEGEGMICIFKEPFNRFSSFGF